MKPITTILTCFVANMLCLSVYAQTQQSNYLTFKKISFGTILLCAVIIFLALVAIYQYRKFKKVSRQLKQRTADEENILNNLTSEQIEALLRSKGQSGKNPESSGGSGSGFKAMLLLIALFSPDWIIAQDANQKQLMTQPGIIITVLLLLLPLLFAAILIIAKANNAMKRMVAEKKRTQANSLAEQLTKIDQVQLKHELEQREIGVKAAHQVGELSGSAMPADVKGILQNVHPEQEVHFTAVKKRASTRPPVDPALAKLVVWYLGCAAFWLVVGTGIGEYVGIKFIAPDADHVSWLSFGRLRPVHTNMVFWGWASLGIIGLGYYVISTVSNTKLYNIKMGWITLAFINAQVILGTISLMAGINNGGGEFREYIWPIMALFAVGLILVLVNLFATVGNRTTKEIYISSWYIIGALMFTVIIALTAYLPFWQNGLGETIIQGYYMHSGVGMWFTLFTLGLLYYFIPQQLNRPIYAYSLGILAFWTQVLFYTVIGTHHFILSPIPWWLQTVAIVGSAGMIIPVIAATLNFMMTFKGQWHKVSNSYTLPFFLTAAVYYIAVSLQGTAEAFRYSNMLWHFTDFTVAHSHLGFYGIITFAIWGGSYAIVPRLTGKEPPHHLVGAHFWLAFIGLLLYAIPLMVGGTIRGTMWMNGEPFINSVVKMFDYWLWRAIGGSLMFISHVIYLYNFYKMTASRTEEIDVGTEAMRQLANQSPSSSN
ncbi:cbb3-type cytochrome c oxidase subunit I [Polluticoccus soli]|uniref:cbb3-type cytochrome c oxidase subunit I n=1 Tax=Polluticoccus soli TaxID=3034150 RepID=UPI0023E0C1EE|nr:cbb3-type cytochrome c oxidase subunit I [Flavipsychrobacter sp. JY13-12]